MIEVEKDLWRTSGSNLPLKQGHLEMIKYERYSQDCVVGLLTTGNDKNPANLHWLILCHSTSGINQKDWITPNQSLSSSSSLQITWQGCRPDGTNSALWVAWRGDASATISSDLTSCTLLPFCQKLCSAEASEAASTVCNQYLSFRRQAGSAERTVLWTSEQGEHTSSTSGYLGFTIALLTISKPSGRLQMSAWILIFGCCPEKIINHFDKHYPKEV